MKRKLVLLRREQLGNATRRLHIPPPSSDAAALARPNSQNCKNKKETRKAMGMSEEEQFFTIYPFP